jgi:DNA invertase Pin-like site-specific DNA recombinase
MDGDPPRRGGLLIDKIQRRHRERLAIVYIRQSTVQQIERHQESTRLQYALVDRAFQFGWARESILVIDDDLGRSGASIEGRLGFQRLVAEVGLGNVGLVLGVEMSRLARSCRDWHQLLEICALFDTLIADAEGVYDSTNYNDRLLLGLKGTMSEAELHILKARMLEGKRAKARRGELGKKLPMGYVRHPSGEIVFDFDEQARATIRLVFDLFGRFRTVSKVMRYLIDHEIRMPVRCISGSRKGELDWRRVNGPSLYNLFANPIYAGAYVYGLRAVDKRRQKPGRPGTGRRGRDAEQAEVFLRDRVPAYISWDQYQANRAQLRLNMAARGGSVRAGTALLAGRIICGRCGLRMNAEYNNNGHAGRYACMHMRSSYGEPICQSLKAAPLDALVTQLLLQALQPAALEASIAVAADLETERAALERHWQQRLERSRYAVERARRQYDTVEPENRMVARTLERAWEEALASQARLLGEYDRFQRERPQAPSPAELSAIRAVAQDVPRIWNAETTTQGDRQSILRLLLERVLVTVIDGSEQVHVECHWHGGNRTSHQFRRPVARLDRLSTYAALGTRAAELYHAGQSCAAIAAILNSEGWRPAKRRDTFNAQMVWHLLLKIGAANRKYHRRHPVVDHRADEWTIPDLAKHLEMPKPTLYTWVVQGRLRSRTVQAGGRQIRLVYADETTIASLRTIRATPPPWRRLPSPGAPETARRES